MKNIIIRTDLRGNTAVFDADTETENSIMMWDGVHGHHMESVSLAYYKSTVPMDDKEKLESLIKGWTSNFGDREIVIRQRLVKRTVKAYQAAQNGPEGSQATQRMVDIEKLKRDLLSAFSKALETI